MRTASRQPPWRRRAEELLNRVINQSRTFRDTLLEQESGLSFRYLVCTQPEAWAKVIVGDLAAIPTTRGKPLLVENEVLDFQRALPPSGKWGRELSHRRGERMFRSLEEYKARYLAAADLPQYGSPHPTYQVRRIPEAAEVRALAEGSPEVRRLLDHGMLPQEALLALVYRPQYCLPEADELVEYYEHFVLRPLAGAFLMVTNHTQRPMDLHGVHVVAAARDEHKVRPLASAYAGSRVTVTLAAPPLEPQESMLIPVATLVQPFGRLSYVEYTHEKREISRDEDVTHYWNLQRILSDDPGLEQRHQLIGPALLPTGVARKQALPGRVVPVRPLDVTRLSLLDIESHWGLAMGSCPHLFFVHHRTGALMYAGEVFARHPGQRSEETVTVPPEAGHLVLAELEEEVTELYGIWRDEERVHGHALLHKGDMIGVPVRPGEQVRLVGRYHVGSASAVRPLPDAEKRARVERFLEAHTG